MTDDNKKFVTSEELLEMSKNVNWPAYRKEFDTLAQRKATSMQIELGKARERRKFPVSIMAKALGVTESFILQVEQGDYTVDFKFMLHYIDLLGLNIMVLDKYKVDKYIDDNKKTARRINLF